MISEDLLAILACPVCKGDLDPDTGRSVLLCGNCSLSFHLQGGIPVMLVDQAERIS